MSTSVSSPSLLQSASTWRDVLARVALLFFGIALWHKGLSFYGYYLLISAWILDGGLGRFSETVKEPVVFAMLVLCIVLALGILWSDDPKLGFKVWNRYFAYLIFIPYLSLLNKARLPWSISGLLAGYFGVLLTGIHEWIIMKAQGIPPLRLTYLDFSTMLGIGIVVALYLTSISKNKTKTSLLWFLAILLLFIQFNQNARAILVATLISSGLLLLLLHKKEIRTLLTVMASLIIVIAVFAYTSTSFHERLAQAERDIELSKLGRYDTSLGYRMALWDVGLDGIAERPFLGHGTGRAAGYFDKTIETYKGGLYKELSQFSPIYHYHNDWIEVGMHLGALGLAAYAFFLWSWFRTLRIHRLTPLGAAFMCFIVLFGLTDVFVIFRQNLYLILIITAIGVAWQKAYGLTSVQTENYPV